MNNHHRDSNLIEQHPERDDNKLANIGRRQLLLRSSLLGASSVAVARGWVKPIVDAVILPAHAQTSTTCIADTTVGGPLAGHPSGALNCADACEAEANDRGAQLCAVNEISTPSGISCECEIDLP